MPDNQLTIHDAAVKELRSADLEIHRNIKNILRWRWELSIGWGIEQRHEAERTFMELRHDLENALKHVKVLEDYLDAE